MLPFNLIQTGRGEGAGGGGGGILPAATLNVSRRSLLLSLCDVCAMSDNYYVTWGSKVINKRPVLSNDVTETKI